MKFGIVFWTTSYFYRVAYRGVSCLGLFFSATEFRQCQLVQSGRQKVRERLIERLSDDMKRLMVSRNEKEITVGHIFSSSLYMDT